MKFFALFIYRPVATILLSVAITLCGVLGFRLLRFRLLSLGLLHFLSSTNVLVQSGLFPQAKGQASRCFNVCF